jgi:hypothetical protein
MRQALLVAVILSFPCITPASSQNQTQPLVTQAINENDLVTLTGNTRPEARAAANDQGAVADDTPLPHMMLQLRRPAAQEQALVALIDQLHDSNSPSYHHWLTAVEIGERFGPAPSDIQAVTGWLSQHGFAVNTVYTNRMVVDFSGTAGQVRSAFRTEIHNLDVNGVAHFANTTDPQIPAALAPGVVGIVSLHDFKPSPVFVPQKVRSDAKPAPQTYTDGITQYISPGDIATIYNFRPMFSGSINGQGQTIYVVGNSQMYRPDDWTDFRTAFGIPNTSYVNVSLSLEFPQPPSGPNNCTNPGINNSDAEATLDVEYASAGAPGANIVLAVCSDSAGPTSGILIAVQNLVNGSNPPAIISVSYQHCEALAGASFNAAINTAYQTGVAEGASIYAAAGDQGASICTNEGETARTGIGVNAFASTPYNVAVGGTDFEDYYLGESSNYWNNGNAADWSSAKSYIPEIPWNSSCGSRLIAQYNGYDYTYGTNGFCNSSYVVGGTYYQSWAGGGGPSGCATGATSVDGVVSGTCAGYAKPAWQSLLGVPNDGVRDLPDVSLFSSGGPSATGPWHRTYVWCYSDTSRGGKACTVGPSGWTFGGFGTSFATPIWAGIQALINQQTGNTRQGNPNVRLYQIAGAEYGNSAQLFSCASNESGPYKGSCIFNDVTYGDTDVPCLIYLSDVNTLYDCYYPSGSTYGVMSSSYTSYAPTYSAQTGWDFATGIGTVNVANLVAKWSPKKTSTHDFYGYGRSDIAWRDTSGNLVFWVMNGKIVSSAANVTNVATTWSVAGQRDFDGDGRSDILWHDPSGNTAIWLMSGTTPTSAVSLGNIPKTWSVAGTGDYNLDGKGDILWRDTSGNVVVWLMNGATVSSSTLVGNVPTTWSIVASTSNRIFWRDTSGNIALWLMNGGAIFETYSLGNVPKIWSIAGTGDFDGDGITDILWRDSSGNLAIWFFGIGLSNIPITSVSIGNVPMTWSVAETGDFDGDRKSDILWRDTSGNTAIWFMNGTTVSSTAGVGSIPMTWTVQSANSE